jgi:nicotinic acid mononucleotide adenylyltransferase
MEIDDLLGMNVRVYVAAAGAGAGIQNILWDVPGASKFLAGAQFPYSAEDMTRFLGYRPDQFVCERTALDMAIRSYLLANNGDPSIRPIGVGLTASVATTHAHRGAHRINTAVVTRGAIIFHEVEIPKRDASDRYYDGRTADALGLSMLRLAAELDLDKIQGSGALNLEAANKAARDALFSRPLFTRTGERLLAPTGEALKLFPGAFNPVHEGHLHCADESVTYQITAEQPHKPALSVTDMLDRLHWLQGKRDVLFLEHGALYVDKAVMFPGSTFIIGSDALERMLDPKWGVPIMELLESFRFMGTKFDVSLRGSTKFEDLMKLIDPNFRHLFRQLPENPFSGLSSTQIRAKTQG